MQSIDGQELFSMVANLRYKVVTNFTRRLENKRQQFFTGIVPFQNLEQQGIYSIRTMRSNCIDLHPSIKNVKEFKERSHRDLDWMMHSLRRLSSITWKDKATSAIYFNQLLMEIV